MPQFQSTHEHYVITATVTQIGEDLLIALFGGDHPHIGSVTTFSSETPINSFRFPSHDGRFHKDHFLAEQLAPFIQPVFNGTCTITAGVHVDHITEKQIQAASQMVIEIGTELNTWLRTHPFRGTKPIYSSDKH
jgi:hypothetical protein